MKSLLYVLMGMVGIGMIGCAKKPAKLTTVCVGFTAEWCDITAQQEPDDCSTTLNVGELPGNLQFYWSPRSTQCRAPAKTMCTLECTTPMGILLSRQSHEVSIVSITWDGGDVRGTNGLRLLAPA